MNPLQPSVQRQQFDLPIKKQPSPDAWFFHPNKEVDIAVIHINFQFLTEHGLQQAFFPKSAVANKEKLKGIGAAAGDGIFVLGFPMNLAGVQKNYVIARQGVIARITDMLEGASPTYLIDSLIFPGNSGGPVILRPELTSIQGTPQQPNSYLIGIVRAYIPYRDVAISPQTKEPRIAFEENSGLAEVLPVDFIEETIKALRDLKSTPGAKPTTH